MTHDLIKRTYQHKNHIVDSFTKKYNIHELVYFEEYDRAIDAIKREKQLKNWHREWKINLIRSTNPCMKDLYKEYIL